MAGSTKPLRLLVALVALVGLLSLATSAARAKKPGDDDARKQRIAHWRHRPDPAGFRTRLPGLVRADTAKEQRQAYRALLKAAMRDTSGLERAAADHEEDDFSLTLPAGDLTGDGRDDAIGLFGSKVQGVRGTDGSVLWSRPFQDWGGYLGSGTFDAVAGNDLLLVEVHEEDLTVAWKWTIRLVAVQGSTGSPLWTRTYENVWTFGNLGSSELYVDIDFAIPWERGELSGDAATDLVMARFDVAFVATNLAGHGSLSAVFEGVSGANGQVVGAYPAAGQDGGFPDAVIVPSFTGDPAADIVTASVDRDGASRLVRLAAFPGKGGAPVWRRDMTLGSQPGLVGARLNADTNGDVLVTSRSGSYTAVSALSGTNGSTLWSDYIFESYPWITLAGDATGDGGQDLLMITDADFDYAGPPPSSATQQAGTKAAPGALKVPALPGHELAHPYACYGYGYGYCGPYIPPPCESGYGYGGVVVSSHYGYGGGGCPAFRVSLLRGSNGQEVWSDFSYGWAEPAGDATGDGVVDILVDGYEIDEAEKAYVPMASVRSGVDGEAVWQRPPQEHAYLFSLGGDVDGREGEDLVALEFGDTDSYRAVSGATGEPLWEHAAATSGWLWYLATARLDGTGGDLLETTISFENWSTDGVARDGADGSVLWRR